MTGPVRVVGRAKVNLHLSVGARRPDGLHEIESVMQTVALSDELTMSPSEETAVVFRWGAGPAGGDPERPDLVERAVEAYRRRRGGPGAVVEVVKRIPLAAGLAGGSADAAAALVGMDALAGGGEVAGLASIGAGLGSDVAFSLVGGTCLVGGAGEHVTPLECPRPLWWVLGISGAGISTASVYRRWDELGAGPPGALHDLVAALAAGDAPAVGALLHNDLARASRDLEPRLAALEAAMAAAGVLGCTVSGSGPTILGLCRDEDDARRAAAAVGEVFDRVEVVTSGVAGAEVLEGPE